MLRAPDAGAGLRRREEPSDAPGHSRHCQRRLGPVVEEAFLHDFAGDLPPRAASLRGSVPFKKSLTTKTTNAAGAPSRPSCRVHQDRTINPDLARFMAWMGKTTEASHLALISHPDAIKPDQAPLSETGCMPSSARPRHVSQFNWREGLYSIRSRQWRAASAVKAAPWAVSTHVRGQPELGDRAGPAVNVFGWHVGLGYLRRRFKGAPSTSLYPQLQTWSGVGANDAMGHLTMRRSKQHAYSITSSARASTIRGTLRPRAFAVLRLMISSNLVGMCTGRSLGFSPLRIRPA